MNIRTAFWGTSGGRGGSSDIKSDPSAALAGRLIGVSSKRDGGQGASSYFMYVAKSAVQYRIERMRFSIRCK